MNWTLDQDAKGRRRLTRNRSGGTLYISLPDLEVTAEWAGKTHRLLADFFSEQDAIRAAEAWRPVQA